MKPTDPTPPATAEKTCAACGQTLPVARFLHAPLYPDALTPRCRPCILAAVPPRPRLVYERTP